MIEYDACDVKHNIRDCEHIIVLDMTSKIDYSFGALGRDGRNRCCHGMRLTSHDFWVFSSGPAGPGEGFCDRFFFAPPLGLSSFVCR